MNRVDEWSMVDEWSVNEGSVMHKRSVVDNWSVVHWDDGLGDDWSGMHNWCVDYLVDGCGVHDVPK